MSKKFSIIIPVYNVESYLEFCLDSVLKQDYDNYEIILIDDGSKDKSADICDTYANKHTAIRVFHKENAGVSRARNMGISMATGEYILFLDSDDTLCEDALSTMANFLDKNDNYDVVFCNYINDTDGIKKHYDFSEIKGHLEETDKLLLIDKIIAYNAINACWNKIYKRNFILENEVYFNDLMFAEDFDWGLTLMLKNPKCIFCPLNLVVYRTRMSSVVNTRNIKKDFNKFDFFEKWDNILPHSNNINFYLSKFYLTTLNEFKFYSREEKRIIIKKFRENAPKAYKRANSKLKLLFIFIKLLGANLYSIIRNYF